MSIEISDKEKNYLKTVLYKTQFQQKLGIKYKLLTGVSIIILLLVILIPFSAIVKSWIYLAAMFVYSKWFFNFTKNKGYYEPLLIMVYANLKRKILLKIRENRL